VQVRSIALLLHFEVRRSIISRLIFELEWEEAIIRDVASSKLAIRAKQDGRKAAESIGVLAAS
jgi:hypothetical protein